MKQEASQKTPDCMQVGATRVPKRPHLHLRWALNQCRFGDPTDIDVRALPRAIFETRGVPEDHHGMQVGAMRVNPTKDGPQKINACSEPRADIDFGKPQGGIFEPRSIPEDPKRSASWRRESPKPTSTPPEMGSKINVGSEPQPTLISWRCKNPTYSNQEVAQKNPNSLQVGDVRVPSRQMGSKINVGPEPKPTLISERCKEA